MPKLMAIEGPSAGVGLRSRGAADRGRGQWTSPGPAPGGDAAHRSRVSRIDRSTVPRAHPARPIRVRPRRPHRDAPPRRRRPYSWGTMPTTSFLTALTERVIVADGAMGTMLQAQDPSLDDFQGYEGCNEILNVTRPDIVAARPRRVLRRRRRLRRDQHVRGQPGQPRGVRHPRADPRAGRGGRPDRPRGRRRLLDPGPPALGARLGRPGHEAAHPGPRPVRRPARRLRRAGRRAARGRRRRGPDRDRPGPAAGQGRAHRRPPGDGRVRASGGRSSPRSRSRPPARCCSARRSARR